MALTLDLRLAIIAEFLFIQSPFLKQWRDDAFVERGMKLA